jgi:hypothetical protein
MERAAFLVSIRRLLLRWSLDLAGLRSLAVHAVAHGFHIVVAVAAGYGGAGQQDQGQGGDGGLLQHGGFLFDVCPANGYASKLLMLILWFCWCALDGIHSMVKMTAIKSERIEAGCQNY